MPDQITTDRLVLRPFTADDGDAVVAILGDFEVSKWLARVPHPFTHADLRLDGEGGEDRWPGLSAITHNERLVGGMSIKAEHFGYWIAPSDHGRGFATEAGRAALSYIFGEAAAEEVHSAHFEGNPASAHVLKKLGFTERARNTHPCAARGHDMPNVDVVLTRGAWQAGQPS